MDITKYLVIIKKEDKTSKIVKFTPDKMTINIKYKDSEKEYTYSRSDFEFYKDPIEINIQNNKFVLKGSYLFNLEKILKFDKYFRILFKDNTSQVVTENDLQMLSINAQETISMNKFNYFKDISKIVSVKTEDGEALLEKEYNKIDYIPQNSALYKYLNTQEKINKTNASLDNLIFPFGANKSQFIAVRNAVSSQISIIEGPPGTGKTQTILNIIANIIKDGKNVAIVSNNNAATENVYEKLEKYNLDYLCARLGRRKNKENFIDNQKEQYPKFWEKLENEETIKSEIAQLNHNISEVFEIQNEIAKKKQELEEIKTQNIYFNSDETNNSIVLPKIRSIKMVTSKKVLRLKTEYEEMTENNFKFRFKAQFLYGIGNKAFYQNNRDYILKSFNKIFFILKEMELENEIKNLKRKLQTLGSNKLEELQERSLKLLHEYLRKKYSTRGKRKKFGILDLYKKSEEIVDEYPIIFSTTYSIKKCLNPNFQFDYIIMDESSQVDIITGVLALYVAKNAVIVGDLKQLPNVVTTESRDQIENITKRYNIESKYNYLQNSFLSSVSKAITDAPRTLLKEHYRCHPKIIQFCNKKFYNNELIIMTEDKGEKDVLKAYITTKGDHARGHINQRQIDVIEKEVMAELTKNVKKENIGIISPYRDQKTEIERTFNSELKVDTIHKFQGREEDAIIITTVDNKIGEFVDDPKMLNVAITRAKKYLRLIVSNSEQNIGTNIDDLVKYIQYNNFEIVESKTKSIFDLLYKENRKARMEYLKNKKRVSDYNSENLIYNLIDEIIKANDYNNLDIAVHVPIMDILANTNLLDEEEKEYSKNVWTHIDFVIYNKMDKKLVIAIEVDGYFYHREGTKQQERDMIKNKILAKYDIPLIRLSTTGSEEKEILERKIKEVFGDYNSR